VIKSKFSDPQAAVKREADADDVNVGASTSSTHQSDTKPVLERPPRTFENNLLTAPDLQLDWVTDSSNITSSEDEAEGGAAATTAAVASAVVVKKEKKSTEPIDLTAESETDDGPGHSQAAAAHNVYSSNSRAAPQNFVVMPFQAVPTNLSANEMSQRYYYPGNIRGQPYYVEAQRSIPPLIPNLVGRARSVHQDDGRDDRYGQGMRANSQPSQQQQQLPQPLPLPVRSDFVHVRYNPANNNNNNNNNNGGSYGNNSNNNNGGSNQQPNNCGSGGGNNNQRYSSQRCPYMTEGHFYNRPRRYHYNQNTGNARPPYAPHESLWLRQQNASELYRRSMAPGYDNELFDTAPNDNYNRNTSAAQNLNQHRPWEDHHQAPPPHHHHGQPSSYLHHRPPPPYAPHYPPRYRRYFNNYYNNNNNNNNNSSGGGGGNNQPQNLTGR
jgi:hypothetical protein